MTHNLNRPCFAKAAWDSPRESKGMNDQDEHARKDGLHDHEPASRQPGIETTRVADHPGQNGIAMHSTTCSIWLRKREARGLP